MIEITKDYKPEKEGKYLVRTVSNCLKTVNIFTAKVYSNGKIDITNQVATHISKHPIT